MYSNRGGLSTAIHLHAYQISAEKARRRDLLGSEKLQFAQGIGFGSVQMCFLLSV
jgi:hypothetical protein